MTWPTATLGEVALSVRNGIFARRPTDSPTGSRILRISAVRGGRVALSDSRFVEGLEPDQIEKFAIKAGDLLVTRYNGSRAFVGIAGIVPPHDGPVIHPDKLIRIVLDSDRADARFVNLQFQSPTVRSHLEPRIRTTAGQSGIAGADVRSIPLVLPPLDEQRRIVDLLEDHFSRLDAAETSIEANIRRAASWHSGLASRLLWAKRYPLVAVADLLREPMRNGRSDRAVSGSEDGTRTLTLTAVTKNAFTDQNTKQTITTADRASGLWLEPGDVFVQRSNTPELVGTTARYDGPREWAIFPDLLIRLRVDPQKIDGRFFTAALRSKEGHNQLRRKAKGLAGSMPKIDQAAISAAFVPVPELAEQERVLAQVEQATDALDKLQSELGRAQRRSAALRRSLLAAAFSGRLASDQPKEEFE
jgi:type I restriction enzyme S subunit